MNSLNNELIYSNKDIIDISLSQCCSVRKFTNVFGFSDNSLYIGIRNDKSSYIKSKDGKVKSTWVIDKITGEGYFNWSLKDCLSRVKMGHFIEVTDEYPDEYNDE